MQGVHVYRECFTTTYGWEFSMVRQVSGPVVAGLGVQPVLYGCDKKFLRNEEQKKRKNLHYK